MNHLGDSRAHLSSKNDVSKQARKVQAWLKAEFGKEFKYEGNQMAHGKQDDTILCGLYLPNAVEHDLFGFGLCTDKMAQLHRMQWFVHLGRAQTEHVSI